MKKIKKLLTIGLAVLFMFCMGISLMGCSSFYCDPKGKEWYNLISLPNIDEPFNEIYDGCYSIEIDKNGNVLFKPLNGEEIKGKIRTHPSDKRSNISIEFENGKWSSGNSYKNDSGRNLIIYHDRQYQFTDKRQLSKEEFETYRSKFIEFLTNIYETGNFPTPQEIADNGLYQQFTNYKQIDPCCGGPIVYATVERATIEKVEVAKYGKEITLNINGTSIACQAEDNFVVASIRNGEIKELSESDITNGDCLVSRYTWWNGRIEEYEYRVSKIFYL